MKPVATNITVEVHCRRPVWAVHHWEERYRDNHYRIYINNDLITERTWIWDESIYLKEHLWANLTPIDSHSIRLEPITYMPEQAKFRLLELSIVGRPLKVLEIKAHEITFKLA
jgi:hypothetical protein